MRSSIVGFVVVVALALLVRAADSPNASDGQRPSEKSASGDVAAAGRSSSAGKPVDFAHDVLPLLKAHCVKCHAAGKHEGDLSIDTRESLLKSKTTVPGDAKSSELFQRVTSGDPDVRMPQKGEPLKPEEIALLRRWIDEGLTWQDGFTFAVKRAARPLAVKRPMLPPPQAGRDQPIDRLVDAYFAQHQVEFPPTVEDAVFARRVYLDLLGLLPTPEQLDAFLADSSPERRTKLVDALLANNRAYAEHWLTFWNDLLRNDYAGTGYIDSGRKQITRWLYDALLENKPYDQFVRELIAPSDASEGFIRGIKWRGNVNASQVVELQFAQNVGQVFLGINLKCASCHDSFIDDWKLNDSYGLAAITAEAPLTIHRCDQPTGQTAVPAFLFPELGTIDAAKPRAERLEQLAALITDRRNGRLARTLVNRLWHRLLGRGIVHPVDAMDGEAFSADLLEYLAAELIDANFDLKHVLRLIATSQVYQARCVEPPDPQSGQDNSFRGPLARRMTAEQFIDAIWRVTDTAPKKAAADVGKRDGEPLRAALVNADLLMRSLGRPNREQVVTTRPDDLSTLQALEMTNGPLLSDLIARGAHNLRESNTQRPAEETIAWLYRATLCRSPSANELSIARSMIGEPPTDSGLADLLWCLLMLPEFQLNK